MKFMWLFVPRVAVTCVKANGLYGGLYIFPLEGCFLLPFRVWRRTPPPPPQRRRAGRGLGLRLASARKWYQIIRRPFFLISGEAREHWFISRHAQKSPTLKVYSISSTWPSLRDTGQIWRVQGASRLAPAWRWCSFNDNVDYRFSSPFPAPLSPAPPLLFASEILFSIGRSKFSISTAYVCALSCLFHLLYLPHHRIRRIFRCMMNELSLSLRPRG